MATADDLQAEIMHSTSLSRAGAQAAAVVRSSDDLLAYMAAEKAVDAAKQEAARLRALAFSAGDVNAMLPDWVRGKFPFDKPKPRLVNQLRAIERFLAPLSDKRARWLVYDPPAADDFGNVGSENDITDREQKT